MINPCIVQKSHNNMISHLLWFRSPVFSQKEIPLFFPHLLLASIEPATIRAACCGSSTSQCRRVAALAESAPAPTRRSVMATVFYPRGKQGEEVSIPCIILTFSWYVNQLWTISKLYPIQMIHSNHVNAPRTSLSSHVSWPQMVVV